jgi:hypothetical protein
MSKRPVLTILLSLFLIVAGYLILSPTMIELLAHFCLGWSIVSFSKYILS